MSVWLRTLGQELFRRRKPEFGPVPKIVFYGTWFANPLPQLDWYVAQTRADRWMGLWWNTLKVWFAAKKSALFLVGIKQLCACEQLTHSSKNARSQLPDSLNALGLANIVRAAMDTHRTSGQQRYVKGVRDMLTESAISIGNMLSHQTLYHDQ